MHIHILVCLSLCTLPLAHTDETSTWPLFSHWLDDKCDIYTAPMQYAFYGVNALSAVYWGASHYQVRKAQQKVVNSVIDNYIKERAIAAAKSHRLLAGIMPVFLSMGIAYRGAVKRAEELDREGDRFRHYYRMGKYSGLEEETSALLARDVVMRSKTREEGIELMTKALQKLDEISKTVKKA